LYRLKRLYLFHEALTRPLVRLFSSCAFLGIL
jgi:hypothetical protein